MKAPVAIVLGGLVLAAAGCGLKGPLYLPEKSGEVVVRPAPAAAPTTTPAEPADPSPATPTAPPTAPPPPQAPPGGPATRG
jgi:predicted small lipoprotein YifL